MAKGINPQFKSDVAALAAYEPRARALALMAEGRSEEFLDWAWTDGYRSAYGKDADPATLKGPAVRRNHLLDALFLDGALTETRMKSMEFKDRQAAERLAIKEVELFGASPLEIALVRGSQEAFERALGPWFDPKLRCAAAGDAPQPVWCSWFTRIHANLEICDDLEPMSLKGDHTLLLLALMLGKASQAEAMVRSGLAPQDSWGWDALEKSALILSGASDESFAASAGLPRERLAEAIDWIRTKSRQCDALESAFELPRGDVSEQERAAAKASALAEVSTLLDQGAPATPYALAVATEWGDLALLERLFKAGGNPNCRHKSGMPMLARIASSALTEKTLQTWLDFGANPTRGLDRELPYGDGWNPSALYQWTFEGRFDLVRQAVEKAAGSVPLRYRSDGKTYAPLLALALGKGHVELAVWMVLEHGCKLGHFDDVTGNACREYGEGDAFADFLSRVELVELKGKTPAARTVKKPLKTRDDLL